MYLTGGIPPQPMVYRCSVDEEWRIQLPVEVRQALNVRPEHRVDLTVKGNKVEMAHAWPCCQLCGGAERLRRLRRKEGAQRKKKRQNSRCVQSHIFIPNNYLTPQNYPEPVTKALRPLYKK